MSALDELHTRAAAALESLDTAEALARRASGKAEDLESRAAAKGWAGVTRGISQARTELDHTVETIGAAEEVGRTGRSQLAAITDQMSSDRVALELAEIRDCLDSAGRMARQAGESVTEAQSFADRTAATVVRDLAIEIKDHLADGDRALTAAMTALDAEHHDAAAWGTGAGISGGGGQPRLPAGEGSPVHVRYPGNVRGALGEHFRSGVHDEQEIFTAEERSCADWLANRYPGSSVHPRRRDPAASEKSPDAMVRLNPDDAGTVIEIKTPDRPTDSAVKRELRDGTHQVVSRGNGHVIIDGRPAGLSETTARRGYARYLGERKRHRRPLADRVTVILADGSELSWRSDD